MSPWSMFWSPNSGIALAGSSDTLASLEQPSLVAWARDVNVKAHLGQRKE